MAYTHTWVIMAAGSWMRKPAVEKIIKENESEGVITVAKMDGKEIFILGAGDSAYGENGERYGFKIDTGNGYRNMYGAKIEVQNTIIIGAMQINDVGNSIGLYEKRSLFVFK